MEQLTLKWDVIELIRFDKLDELKAAIGERLGCTVVSIEIKHVNYLKDCANLEIIYKLD